MSEEAAVITEEKKSRKGIGGPNTKEGKERIRLNALKMGLHANSIEGRQAVADVIGVEFESVLEEMRAYYQPADPLEEVFVHRIARCSWKLMVIESVEDVHLRTMQICLAPGTLEGLSVIERRTDTQLHRAITALAAKRKQEHEIVKNKLADLPSPFPNSKFPLPNSPEPSARELRAAFRARPSCTHLDLPKAPGHPLKEQERSLKQVSALSALGTEDSARAIYKK